MRRIATVLFGLLVTLAASQASANQCDKSYVSQSKPDPIVGHTDDQYSKFDWMADADVTGGQTWACNCILNKDVKGWAGQWAKGGITVAVLNPLEPSGAACREVYLGDANIAVDQDTNAPIIYATSNQVQQAAVFISPTNGANTTSSEVRIRSSTKGCETCESPHAAKVDITVSFDRKEKDILASVSVSEGLIVGIPSLNKIYTDDQVGSVLSQLKDSKDFVGWKRAAEWSSNESIYQLLKTTGLDDGNYLLLSNKLQFSIPIDPSKSTKKVKSQLLVFNSDREPLLAVDFDALTTQ